MVVDDHTSRRPDRAPCVRCLISSIMVLSSVVSDSVAPPGLVMLVTLCLGLPPQALFGRRSAAWVRCRFATGELGVPFGDETRRHFSRGAASE